MIRGPDRVYGRSSFREIFRWTLAGQTPLHDAVINLKFGCVEELIKDGPRKGGSEWKYNVMNAQDDKHKMTALQHVIEHCAEEVCNKRRKTDIHDLIRMAEMMIE